MDTDNLYLIDQFILAEAYDAHVHGHTARYECAMELAGRLEAALERGITLGDVVHLAEEADYFGLKSATDLWEEAAWSMTGATA